MRFCEKGVSKFLVPEVFWIFRGFFVFSKLKKPNGQFPDVVCVQWSVYVSCDGWNCLEDIMPAYLRLNDCWRQLARPYWKILSAFWRHGRRMVEASKVAAPECASSADASWRSEGKDDDSVQTLAGIHTGASPLMLTKLLSRRARHAKAHGYNGWNSGLFAFELLESQNEISNPGSLACFRVILEMVYAQSLDTP